MKQVNWPDEDTLVAYALGILSPEETARVEAHLREHPEDAATVRDYLEGLSAMVLSEEPAELPDDAEDKLLARIRGGGQAAPQDALASEPEEDTGDFEDVEDDRDDDADDAVGVVAPPKPEVIPAPPRPRRVWLGLAAAAVLVALAWFGFLQPRVEDLLIARRIEQYRAQPGAETEELVDDQGQRFATVVRLPDNRVFVAFEAPPPQERVYQAWEIVGDTPFPVGLWNERTWMSQEPLEPGSVFGVTIEPAGGSPAPTSEPIVVIPLS